MADLLLLCANNNLGGTFNALSGWTSIRSRSNGSDGVAGLWYRYVNSEPANYTVTVPGSTTTLAGHILKYTNVDPTSPIRDSSDAISTANVTVSNTPSALTGVQATDLVLLFYCWGAWSSTAPTSCFPRYPSTGSFNNRSNTKSTVSGSGNYVSTQAVVDKVGATGTFPTTNVTTTSGGSTAVAGTWITLSVALKGIPGAYPVGSWFGAF